MASTQTQVPAPTTNLSLDDFPTKELIGENDHYSIYLVNPTTGDSGKTGEIVVINKNTNALTKMNGAFAIFGVAIVSDDGKGQYVLLSTGTYTLRNAIVLSLAEQDQAVDKFCMSGGQGLFWNDYFIYGNCDRLQNRPWGIGEAPSVMAINLKTGAETVIGKSDLTHQYKANQIEGNNLRYTETYVDNEADWADQNLQKTAEKIYDLNLLGSN